MQKELNILHLEDNRLDAELIRETLTAQGIIANISPVQTEKEFRTSLGNGNVDLILADYSLPALNGMTALAIARENCPELPFIFVSGTIGEESAIEGLKSGATDYVFKHRLQRLGLSVRRALSEAGERRQRADAEQALRESDERHRPFFESNPLPMWLFDIETLRFLAVNDAAIRHYGYSQTEFLSMTIKDIRSPEDVPALLESVPQSHPGIEMAGVWKHRKKDGAVIDVEITSQTLKFAGRSAQIVLANDITERRRLEEAERSSELRYRRLFESAKDGILILDADSGQIVDVNPFLIELLGFSKEEFVGKELWQIGLFKDVTASRLAFAELQQRGYIRYEDLPLETRDGSVRPVEFVSNSYLVGESRVIQCNIRDITERKRFEQTLHEKNIELGNANLAKDRFLANISHELRTPLNAIIGFTGTLLMGLPGPLNADQEHQLSIVQTSARHLLSLINDLLDLAKVESGKVEVKYEPLVCQGIVEEVAAALRPLAEGKGLEFKIKAPKSSVNIAADRRILSQILINLSNNAIKFTEKGQVRIQLRTRQSDGQKLASIEVIDTGIGIRSEDQEKLFQAFQQVNTDHRSEGTGLGLYLSEKLAVLIKGKIEFESEYGKGSTFRLLIPTA
jgi:PAS domain S-box-containing protein